MEATMDDHYDVISDAACARLGIDPEAPVYRVPRRARVCAHTIVRTRTLAPLKRAAARMTRRAWRHGARSHHPGCERTVC